MGWKFELKKYVFAVLLAGFIFLALSLYIFFRRGYYTLYIANKAFAGDAALLLAIVFLLGPFSRFFNVFDRFLQYRKEIGILAFFLGLVHGVVSFFFLPNYFPQARFLTGLNWSFIYGLIGLVLLILVYLISNKRAEVFFGYEKWWKMQNWGLRLIVFFTVLHVFVMKFNGWVRWYLVGVEATLARPELPGGGLLVGWLLFFAVLIRLAEFGGVKFARFVCYLSAVLIPLIFGFTFWWGSLTVAKGAACLSRTQVENAVKNDKKCLVIFNNKVYDMTLASRWDLTGHLGRHLCGKEYSKEEIEKGPHPVSVMDKFLLTELCQGK